MTIQLPRKNWKLLAGVTVMVGNKNAFLPYHLPKCWLPSSLIAVVGSHRVPVFSRNIVGETDCIKNI